MDTSNDAAIAAALQDDLNHSSNKRSQDPSVNTSNTSMQLQSLVNSKLSAKQFISLVHVDSLSWQ